MTNTAAVFSCIQLRNVPNTLAEVPLSPDPDAPEANPFSISSIHMTQGAIASAVRSAVRMFCSLAPTSPPNTRPMSSRTSGSDQADAIALAVNDFPQPGTPVTSTPFGAGRP